MQNNVTNPFHFRPDASSSVGEIAGYADLVFRRPAIRVNVIRAYITRKTKTKTKTKNKNNKKKKKTKTKKQNKKQNKTKQNKLEKRRR